MTRWWWVELPRRVGRRWRGLSAVAADGYVLSGLGPVAGLLPLLALGGGLVVGIVHPGFEVTFTESLALVLIVLAAGMVSTQLGALAVLGFAVGDFFVHHSEWAGEARFAGFGEDEGLLSNPVLANLVIIRVPLLIQYALLFALAVGVPVGARGLAASIAGRLRLPDGVHFIVTTVLIGITAFVLARLWASAAPLVIRPVFTWTLAQGINGGAPPVGAIEPIQANEAWITRTAVLAVFGRGALTWLIGKARPAALREVEAEIGAPIERSVPEKGWRSALAQAAVFAVLGVLLLAGMIVDLWAAGAAAGVFFVARLARSGVIPVPTGRWREVLGHIPVLVRFGAVLLVMNGVAKAVWAAAERAGTTGEDFQFMVWPVAGSVLLWAFAMPDPPRPAPAGAAEGPGPPGGDPHGGRPPPPPAPPPGRGQAPPPPPPAPPAGPAPPPSPGPGQGAGPTPPPPPPGPGWAPGGSNPPGVAFMGPADGGHVRPARRDVTRLLVGVGRAVGLLVVWLALSVAMAQPAGADNCGTPSDCFGAQDAASDALLGMMLLGFLSMAIDFIPVVGTAKGVVEAVTGRDLLTGQELSPVERMLGILPGFLGVFRHADEFAGAARHFDEFADAGRHTDDLAPPPRTSMPSRPRPSGRPTGGAGRADGDDAIPPGRPPGDTPPLRQVTGSADEIADVQRHLSDLDALDHPPNRTMLDGIEEAQRTGRPLSDAETNFLRHELTEAELMRSGMSYDEAHAIAGQQHPTFANYSPEVIAEHPEFFNSNWFRYWGITP